MITIAIYSLKGGVGKSTLAVNLAWCASALSARRTLLWDLDPQAASSWILGDGGQHDRAQALFSRDVAPAKMIERTRFDRLELLPADHSLRDLNHLFRELDKKRRLRKLIADLGDHDVVILDCPPGLTETADQVARAADLIVVPVIPSPLSQRAFATVEAQFGGQVPMLPVHVMVDRRRALHVEAMQRHPDWPAIPMASAVENATARRLPVGVAAPRSPVAAAFTHLWRRIERRPA
ncbi:MULTISPECIES: ParA family protein [Sphingomonas]|jgi:chromosome partitioning protein|uniref:ParA family protein n=1 Tax=Sphingomonas adhaesiva TaxID=28212 RepID=A0A2A4I9Y1_9SPHN|nr:MULTISPECIES: ParA family protein [Sphingomonas]PCG14958.1 ParA family protein [Sphingomonas adhaesiva]PZU81343.1 MAG: ParA family protein [Sphingomonas sp.]